LPSLGGVDQQPEVIEVFAVTGGVQHFVGRLDQPILDPANITTSQELSRVAPDGGNPNVGASGLWWYQQLLTPIELVQAAIIGQNPVNLQLALQVADRDASGYGTGIERITVEIMRGAVAEPTDVFPIHLHRSYINSRRWTPAG
jgi:hypothetical protein